MVFRVKAEMLSILPSSIAFFSSAFRAGSSLSLIISVLCSGMFVATKHKCGHRTYTIYEHVHHMN